jgi:hypothetical protein
MATEKKHEEPPVERIVLAFGEAAPAAEAAAIAAALAKGLEVSLVALLVEDERLLRLAELPIAREMGFTSALLRPVGREEVERALRVQAERARRLIERVAESFALSWTLEVVRGNLLRAALERVGPGDLVVLWRGARYAPAPQARGARARRTAAAAPSAIVVVWSAGAAGSRALHTGRALARVTGGDLVLLAHDSERVAVDADRLGARIRRLAEFSTRSVMRLLREAHAGLLVVARDALDEPVTDACEQLACPICLVA